MSYIEKFAALSAGQIALSGKLPPWLNKGGGESDAADSPKDMSDAELKAAVAKLKDDDESPKAKALRAELAKRKNKKPDDKDKPPFPPKK